MRAVTFFLLVASCLVRLPFVSGVSITEIMYDPSGSDNLLEYVELATEGQSLAGWTIADAKSSDPLMLVQEGSGTIALIVEEGSTISAEGAWVYHAGPTIGNQLNNAGDTITVRDATGTIVVTASYKESDGGHNDGNSLCNLGGGWVSCQPTPGMPNAPNTFERYLAQEDPAPQGGQQGEQGENLIKQSAGGQQTRATSTTTRSSRSQQRQRRDAPAAWYATTLFFAGVLVTVYILWWAKQRTAGDTGSVNNAGNTIGNRVGRVRRVR